MLEEALFFFDDWELSTVFLLMGVCLLAAMMSGMSGFGGGLLVTVFITPIIGPAAVVPVISVMMLITNATRIYFYWGGLDFRLAALILATAIPFAIVGAVVYVNLTPEMIGFILGAFLIVSVPLRRWFSGKEIKAGTGATLTLGGVFGFITSTTVGGGIMVVPILLGAGLAGPALLGTDAVIAVVINLVKMTVFGSMDALSPGLFVMGVAMGLSTIPGTWAASWIVKRTSLRIHTLLLEGVVIIGGFSLIYNAYTAL